MVEDKGCGENAVEKLNRVDTLDDLRFGLSFQGDNQLAGVGAPVELGALYGAEAFNNGGNPVGAAVNHEARNVAFTAHDTLSGEDS